MIIKDEMKDNLDNRKKIKSLLQDVDELPEGYGYWFENGGKRFIRKYYNTKMYCGIYKLTAVNFCNMGDPDDTLIAEFDLLKDNIIRVTFYYKDSYKLLIPYLFNSKTKFKIVRANSIKDMSPATRLKTSWVSNNR